ncbi:MAG TPA: response regulator [Acetobacteraceae bacterium]|jgi:CheY-like chemotaxis protein
MAAKLVTVRRMVAMQTDPLERIAIVADDSSLIRDYVRAALGPPWRVYPVANGVEAVEFARSARPQLIMLDVRMPRMDGIEACARIRTNPECAGIPVVILTAYDDVAVRRRAKAAGATKVIAKPFTFESLRAQISDVLSQTQATNAGHVRSAEHPDGARLEDREMLEVCRRAEAAAESRPHTSFAEAMDALREAERF